MKELLSLQFTIFVLIAVGVLVKKKKIIGTAGQKNITDLVIYVVLPCNTVMSFLNGKVDSSLGDCVTVLVISVVIQIFCVAYGKIAYSKEKEAKKKCLQYGIICSNAGFLGNPIAEGIYGSTGLMLASIYLIPLRIMMWSEGLRVFSGSADKKETVKKVITHPCVLACLIGLVLMLLPVSLPGIATIGLFYALAYWNEWYKALLYIHTEWKYPLQYLIMEIQKNIQFVQQNAAQAGVVTDGLIPAETTQMATAVVTIGPIILLYPFLQKYFVQGLTVGSVKG